MEGVDYLADERRKAEFDVDSMKIVWAGSKHAFDLADRISTLVAVDPWKKLSLRNQMAMAKNSLELHVIDLSSSDRLATARSIHQACMECGFFYLINHGVENELIRKALDESREFFSLPLQEKVKLLHKDHRGYTPLYAEKLDTSLSSKGDSKETFYIGPLEVDKMHLNQWPSREILRSWRFTMELYYEKVLDAGRRLLCLIALALNLEEDFFLKQGPPEPFLRLLHYPGEQGFADEKVLGASAHSDYGMITLLMSDGVPGLQVCREKLKEPKVWEDVDHISGAFVVNIGDLMERWTNCLYRSTLHRVIRTGQERYSMAFFPNPCFDSVVECLRSCCSEASPPRFPPIRSRDYLNERFRVTYIEQDATTWLQPSKNL